MKHYWIIGHPLSFCLTTPVMNGLFERMGFSGHFETKNVSPEELIDVVEKLKSGELAGIVTTMPHKTPTIAYIDGTEDAAKVINGVNLVLNEEGELKGYNTDWLGVVGVVREKMPNLKGVNTLVLGAGGAARAAAYGLQKQGANVAIWNRTPERARAFAEKIGIEWVEDMREWEGKPQVIINATSLSYQPKQSTLVPFPLWESAELAIDAVYGKTSLFLEEAKAANVPHVLPGEHWFLRQFLPMFKIITGQEAPVETVTELIREAQIIRQD